MCYVTHTHKDTNKQTNKHVSHLWHNISRQNKIRSINNDDYLSAYYDAAATTAMMMMTTRQVFIIHNQQTDRPVTREIDEQSVGLLTSRITSQADQQQPATCSQHSAFIDRWSTIDA